MKIFGFEIDIDSEGMDLSYRDAISTVMENPRVSIEFGIHIINQLINGDISEEQLYAYVFAQDSDRVVAEDVLFAHLDRWHEQVGFSEDDILYLQSQPRTKEYQPKPNDIPSIVQYISSRVIGQDTAIKTIVTAVWMHVNSVRKNLGIQIPAQLLIGNTGVGKTQILNLLSEIVNVPIIDIYTTTIVAPGYKGGDSLTDQIFSQYLSFATDSSSNQPVIVCIHEIDKAIGNNDGYRIELLSSIMAIIEKNIIHKSNPIGESQSLDLKKVLVLFDGCFEGIEKIVAGRLGLSRIGFNQVTPNSTKELRAKITKADLLEYGMMKEFVGRIANPICLNSMTQKLMYDILLHSKESPIISYISAFKNYGINLKFSSEALKTIAQIAFENEKFGARAIEAVVTEIMEPYTLLLTSKTKDNVLIGKRDVYRIMSKGKYLHR